ncbi:MAG TPA: T9SS type A sorting domain-containing protein [Ignavibacteria bacterium]|nr:T9SS type A sorting domain-containing protein [Ignavibacteria bacterium]
MKTLCRIFIGSYLILSGFSYSQNMNITKYFPLSVGNVWVYHGTYFSIQCQSSFKVRVRIDSVFTANGKTYYKFTSYHRVISGGNCTYGFLNNYAYRIDSVNGNIYRFMPNPLCSFSPDERVIDSLRSLIGDTIYICGESSDPKRALTDTSSSEVFGSQKKSRLFRGGNFHEFSTQNKYAEDFGLIYYGMGGMSLSSQGTLTGCVINGVLYGDTSYYILGLTKISGEIPEIFSVSQNYPNPFNPSTQISFDIPLATHVNLIIYDQIGREIEILMDEYISPGSYKYEWNAANYPSGIYFYKLQAGDYVETKKMVLIK